MAQMKYEDYVKLTARNSEEKKSTGIKARVGYFALKEDGESSVVRFNVATLDDIKIVSKHTVKTPEGKTRIVSCLREDPNQPLSVCPLCEAGERVSFRAYVPLISYEEGEEGELVAVPALWEQAPKIRETLGTFTQDYGDLRDYLFKIVRSGKRGDPSTTYTILPANPKVYKDEMYKKDFSGFDSLNFEYFVATKTPEEMRQFLSEGDFPFKPIEQPKSRNLEQVISSKEEEKKIEEELGLNDKETGFPTHYPESSTRTSTAMSRAETSVVKTTQTPASEEVRRPRRYTY